MLPDPPPYPFVPWTDEEIAERIVALSRLAWQDLQNLAEFLSEGLEDIPPEMQAYYRAVLTERAKRPRKGR